MTTPRASTTTARKREPPDRESLSNRPKIKSAQLSEVLSASELIPQAVVKKPIDAFASLGADVCSGADDLDEYRGLGFYFGDTPFAIMHYRGHPADTSTIYLPFDVRDAELIGRLLRMIFSHFKLRDRDIDWQRKGGADL
jgi:hypothetical protein